MSFRTTRATLVILVGLWAASPAVKAEPEKEPAKKEAADKEAARLKRTREAERYELDGEDSVPRGGGARIHVAAPSSQVKKLVSDFRNYSKFIEKFDKAKVIGRRGGKTDVYLQVPILKGAGRIWAVLRFSPLKSVGGEDVLEGHMLKGNVKRLDAFWRIKKIDDDNTQLNLELVIFPNLPVPGPVITTEAKRAARSAVIDVRNKAEREEKKKTEK